MELQVGFGDGQMHRNSEAERIWNDFSSSVDLPFAYDRLRQRAYGLPVEAGAVATFVFPGHPEYSGTEYLRIVLGRRFPDGDDERVLTLLHESLHLAAFMQSLRQMYEEKASLSQHHNHVPFAFILADQLFEADAEFSLRTRYPALAAARISYYTEFQRRAFNGRPWAVLRQPTKPYALLVHRLRLELASLLTDADEKKAELIAWHRSLGEELLALDLTSGTLATVNQLEKTLSPARSDFSDLAFWGPATYREVVTGVIASHSTDPLNSESHTS